MKHFAIAISFLLVAVVECTNKTERPQTLFSSTESKEEVADKDSMLFHIAKADSLKDCKKYELGLREISKANHFAHSPANANRVTLSHMELLTLNSESLISSKKYKKAIPYIDTLLLYDSKNIDLLYDRATCYSKIGKRKNAAEDLKPGFNAGDKKSVELYNKVNPIKKHIVGYVTRCCDGSISYSTGRGTCSHHDGVCDWNEPQYEAYREY